MNLFLRIETDDSDVLKRKYGLATRTGVIRLPIIYDWICVEEKGGFVHTDLRNDDGSHTYEIYEIKEGAKLERVESSETTEFIYSFNQQDIIVMKIDGKIRVIKNLNKSLL